MLIFGPLPGPRISAGTRYPPSTAGSLMTLLPSTTSTADSVRLDPTSPLSLSTVRTSSTDAFSCLPPQRTIAYTVNSLPCACPPRDSRNELDIDASGLPSCTQPPAGPPLDLSCAPTPKATRLGAPSDRRCRRLPGLPVAGLPGTRLR